MIDFATSAKEPSRLLTGQEFIEILEGKKKGMAGYEDFYGSYRYPEKPYLIVPQAVIIDNIHLNDIVDINDNFNAMYPIFVLGGLFKNNFWLSGGVFERKIEIRGGEFFADFAVLGCKFIEDFKILGDLFKDDFYITDGQFNGQFIIEGGEFKRGFIVSGGVFLDEIHINKGNFEKKSGITNGIFEKISIKYGTFNYMTFAGGIFNKDVSVEGGIYSDSLSISAGTFKENLNINGGESKQISLSDEEGLLFINKCIISFDDCLYGKVDIRRISDNKFICNTIKLIGQIKKDSLLKLDNLTINSLIIKDLYNFGTINIVSMSASHKYFNVKFKIQEYLLDIENIFKQAEINIYNSDIGKTTLIECSLEEFKLYIKGSKINELFLAGTKMPNIINTNNEFQKPDWEQRRISYSQIKKVYEARGDSVGANEFFVKEMDALNKIITWRYNFWDKLNLTMNAISTYHGLRWQQGLFTTLLVGLIFFETYCFALG